MFIVFDTYILYFYSASRQKNSMNTVGLRLAEILKIHPPFNSFSIDDIRFIVNGSFVINIEKGKSVFNINDFLHENFYVVASGVINLNILVEGEETMINKIGPGGLFGLRPLFEKSNYQINAIAREESILFSIPVSVFKPFMDSNPDVIKFLKERFDANTISSPNINNQSSDTIVNSSFDNRQSEIQYFQTLNYNKTPLQCDTTATAIDIARQMTDNLSDHIIVSNKNAPLGIITDADFRSKIATGRYPLDTAVKNIMSAVVTIAENTSLAEAQLLLISSATTHLCVTKDGSNTSAIVGSISQRDLITAQANNPGILIKEINVARKAIELKKVRGKLADLIQSSLSKNIPMSHINAISGEVTIALIKRCVELAILEMGSAPTAFAWLSIGSQGRKEQLLLTDQNSILIFQNVAADQYRGVKDYFIRLARKVAVSLEEIGFPKSPNDYSASNLLWCKSLEEWQKMYSLWMLNPGKSKEGSTIFFDYELVFGDAKLEEQLTDTIFENLKSNRSFFDYLGNDALRKPPAFGFFKKFNIEEDGPHKGKFDIKTRGLLPFIEAARMMTLSQNIRGVNNTYLRLKELAVVDKKNAEIFHRSAEAFLIISKYRAQEGFKNDSNGQYVDLDAWTKNDREKLKAAMTTFKELEELIKDTFKLTQFS